MQEIPIPRLIPSHCDESDDLKLADEPIVT